MVGTGLATVTVEVVEFGDGRTYHNSGPPSETVTVQVGAFSDRNNADLAIRKLKTLMFEPSIEETGTGLQRVLLPEIPKDDLELIRLKLADLGFADVLIRH
jgi:hypothetical protein